VAHGILIVGEDPARIDFSAPGAPPDMSAEKVMLGLEGSRDRLRSKGHRAEILLTDDAVAIEARLKLALQRQSYDVVVIGAGLRTLPAMSEKFETLINALHRMAPEIRFAFNSHPDDSDTAALRQL
jgi:PleD family two-component response regulator